MKTEKEIDFGNMVKEELLSSWITQAFKNSSIEREDIEKLVDDYYYNLNNTQQENKI